MRDRGLRMIDDTIIVRVFAQHSDQTIRAGGDRPLGNDAATGVGFRDGRRRRAIDLKLRLHDDFERAVTVIVVFDRLRMAVSGTVGLDLGGDRLLPIDLAGEQIGRLLCRGVVRHDRDRRACRVGRQRLHLVDRAVAVDILRGRPHHTVRGLLDRRLRRQLVGGQIGVGDDTRLAAVGIVGIDLDAVAIERAIAVEIPIRRGLQAVGRRRGGRAVRLDAGGLVVGDSQRHDSGIRCYRLLVLVDNAIAIGVAVDRHRLLVSAGQRDRLVEQLAGGVGRGHGLAGCAVGKNLDRVADGLGREPRTLFTGRDDLAIGVRRRDEGRDHRAVRLGAGDGACLRTVGIDRGYVRRGLTVGAGTC